MCAYLPQVVVATGKPANDYIILNIKNMSLDYLKLKPKRFPKKSHKHALEARYWKKFETIPIDTES